MSVQAQQNGQRLLQTAPVLAAGLALLAFFALVRGTAAAMVGTWYESNAYNHCFLIVPISLYLAWRQRDELARTPVAPTLWGALAMAAASLLWLLGRLSGTILVQELAMVAAIQSIVLTVFGWRFCRACAFPLLYLYLAVPLGQSLEPRLQDITAEIAVGLLKLSGIPVFADGYIIAIPTGTFMVAEECSGVRFLIASVALAVLFAGMTYRAWWRRAAFLALAIVLPILANGVRAFGIVFIAHATSNEFAAGVDHIVYGWIFFTLVSFLLLAIGMRFREPEAPSEPLRPLPLLSLGTPLWAFLLAGAVAVTPAAAAALYADRIDRVSVATVDLSAPAVGGSWRLVEQSPSAALDFKAPDAGLHAVWARGSQRVALDIGYYVQNRRGAQAVTSDHDLAGRRRWTPVGAGERATTLDRQPMTVEYLRGTVPGGGRMLWYWYWIDGRFTGDPYVAKLLDLKAKLLGGSPAAAIIAVSADYVDTPADAEQLLGDFTAALGDLGPTLTRAAGR